MPGPIAESNDREVARNVDLKRLQMLDHAERHWHGSRQHRGRGGTLRERAHEGLDTEWDGGRAEFDQGLVNLAGGLGKGSAESFVTRLAGGKYDIADIGDTPMPKVKKMGRCIKQRPFLVESEPIRVECR